MLRRCRVAVKPISIHAPRGGERPVLPDLMAPSAIFQSTLPVGGATGATNWSKSYITISIHAPRGGSDYAGKEAYKAMDISIHAPRGGSDSRSFQMIRT